FDAAGDGEYAFAVRTVDREGELHPPGPLTAGLVVTVDTAPPSLNLEVEATTTGDVTVRWEARDAHLDVESLQLEHMDPTTDGWQPMQIIAMDSGQTSWTIKGNGSVRIRGTISDMAGNETTAESEASLRSNSDSPALPDDTLLQGPIAGDDANMSVPGDLAEGGLPSIHPNNGPFSRPVSVNPQQQPAVTQPRWNNTPGPQVVSSVRRVNSTNFQIGYVLDDVGPSGVSSVELYLTEDDGQKWYHYGVDEDGHSPFQLTVPNDGTYGFAIRVKSGVGLAHNPPQPGEKPELVVVVDRKPPQATILPLKQGQGSSLNQLVIEWTLTDEALAEHPVALYYAERQTGPWQPITGWQPNTGQYTWNFGPELPKQVYIRLEARDAAGNIARVDSEAPMLIDLSRPTARIIEVESVQ
ncbi:MAG: hypothetical protein KDA86_20990, partial [Planctomycetaceae bacterium]|nr:hypothetical protein [Planctomycetaceae bacterium]